MVKTWLHKLSMYYQTIKKISLGKGTYQIHTGWFYFIIIYYFLFSVPVLITYRQLYAHTIKQQIQETE